jgi:hypothetical protein
MYKPQELSPMACSKSNSNRIVKVCGKNKAVADTSSKLSTKNIRNLHTGLVQKECSITDESKSLIDNLNRDVFACANQPFSLALTMDESTSADNDVRLTAEEIKFLRKHADPPAIDFVEQAMTEISIANRELQSFKLGLKLEPAIEGGGAA